MATTKVSALSALTASLKTIPLPLPGVAVTVTFAPRTTSPVTSSAPLPKLMSPLKVISALPVVVVVSKIKLKSPTSLLSVFFIFTISTLLYVLYVSNVVI